MASDNDTIVSMLTTRYTQFASLDSDQLIAFAQSARITVTPFFTRLGDKTDLALMYKTGALAAPMLYMDAEGRVLEKEKVDNSEYKWSTSGAASLAVELENQYQALLPKRYRKIYVLGAS